MRWFLVAVVVAGCGSQRFDANDANALADELYALADLGIYNAQQLGTKATVPLAARYQCWGGGSGTILGQLTGDPHTDVYSIDAKTTISGCVLQSGYSVDDGPALATAGSLSIQGPFGTEMSETTFRGTYPLGSGDCTVDLSVQSTAMLTAVQTHVSGAICGMAIDLVNAPN